jgi:hypothetical protein
VTFTNPKDVTVEIPAGTRVKTAEAVVFTTDDSIEILAGGSEDVDITAVVEGDAGAVEADTIRLVEGDLEGDVTVTNADPTDPEGTVEVPAVSEDDQATLRTVVIDVVSGDAMEELESQNPGALVFEDTLDVTIVDEQFSAEIGEEANWVTIDAELSVTAIAASAADLQEMAKFWLAEDLLEDEVLLDKTLDAEVVPGSAVTYDPEAATVTAEILLEGGIVPAFDPQDLKEQIAGSSVSDARAYLADEIPSLTEPVIDRGPGWLPGGMPRFDWRIQLVVEPGP